MKQRRQWFLKYPLVPAFVLPLMGILLISVLSAVLYPLLCAAAPSLPAADAENALGGVLRCLFALGVVLVMKKSSGGAFYFGFGGKNSGRSILLSLFCLAHVAETLFEGFFFSEGFRSDASGIIAAILTGLGAGVFEETVCRGVVLSNMMDRWRGKRRRILLSALVSGGAFGLLHLMSLSAASVPWVVLQIFVAAGLGIFFGAVYLRTRSLWGPVILHSLMDAVYFLFVFPAALGAKDYIVNAAAAVLFALAGLYLIRPAKHSDIAALWNERP